MRGLLMAAVAVAFGGVASAADVKIGPLKATPPTTWKMLDSPGLMRTAQFVVPKADGDKEDADVSIFETAGGGSVEDNMKRQVVKFAPAEGKEKVEVGTVKVKVGGTEGMYQDLKGTFQKKAFPKAEKATPLPNYRQLYVIWIKDEVTYSLWMVGPAKTVEANKKAFDEFVNGLR